MSWSVRVGSVWVGSVLVGEGVLGWGGSSHFWWSKGSAVTIDLFPAGGGAVPKSSFPTAGTEWGQHVKIVPSWEVGRGGAQNRPFGVGRRRSVPKSTFGLGGGGRRETVQIQASLLPRLHSWWCLLHSWWAHPLIPLSFSLATMVHHPEPQKTLISHQGAEGVIKLMTTPNLKSAGFYG